MLIKPDLTSTTMLRMILDYASSVDEAVELVKKYDDEKTNGFVNGVLNSVKEELGK